ncbi:ER membrane protein complex subunit 7 [Entomortierella parvispora]|uniref:ER membrane protein complex subunit 7 n=1 Tax=Entomortierella parvispora TaxID=205924 RepID=A0A9P3H960_9FUNG|nr:ER membrane protein complex subunit 7 [Entomortierella parvispora]
MKAFFPRRIVACAAALIALVSLAAPSVSAIPVAGFVVGHGESAHPRDISPRTRVVLSGGQYSTMITKDGRFIFPDVAEGTYALEVQSPQYIYPNMRLVVSDQQAKAYIVSIGADWSNNDNAITFPITLVPRAPAMYFIPREGFQIKHLFANPMMLMMGFSVIMLFVMPKLMANMDPEAMQEMQGMQEAAQMPAFEMPDISASLAKFSTGGSSSAQPAAGSAKKRH